MKLRLITICVLASAGGISSIQAHRAPDVLPLPNYDVRQTIVAAGDESSVPTSSAIATLRGRVNGLRLSQDALSGGPRFLAAQRGFLTGASGVGFGLSANALAAIPTSDGHRVVKAFVNEHQSLFGFNAQSFQTAAVKVDAVTPRSGMRTVIWQQELDQIPVYGGLFVSHLTKNEELAAISSRFVPDLQLAAARIEGRAQLIDTPPISASEALRLAAYNLGETDSSFSVQNVGTSEGVLKKQTFRSAQLLGDAYAQLVWLPVGRNELELTWQVILTSRVRPEMYLLLVNVETGAIRLRRCLTEYITPATYNVYTSDSPSPFSPGSPSPAGFQPSVVSRTLVTLTALNTNASPNGWINDGDNTTVGNNVHAHLDRNNDNAPDLPLPTGNPNRVFDFPLDLGSSPVAYGDAAVVNLFYWNNVCHDRLYELGFTEAFGNFQNDNFGRGGVGNDAVRADAQDGGGVNNANFSAPPDGIPGRMQMYLFTGPNPDRDGSLDAEVMIHEYVHGLSNRLLGGGAGITALQTRGMGEGWSDFYALSLLSEPTDDPRGVYATGGYLTYQLGTGFQDNYYFGIRRYPYSTDMLKNPLTLKDIDPTRADLHAGVPINPVFGGGFADEVHNQGEVWCMVLWEARANLIEKWGYEAGNQLMLQLVTDGLKLAPQNATFLEARDGILLADEILSGGDNLAELWTAFAKRGFGWSAAVPPSFTTVGVVEAYDLPDFISVNPLDGILEVKVSPDSGSALFGNSLNEISVRVTDSVSVTNATIIATLSNGETLTFRNDGEAPDLTAGNAIYTAEWLTPNQATNVVLTLIISAPEKETATNIVSYAIVPTPLNDNFNNATKVPATGASYVTLNSLASIESGEPQHAGVASVAASLWWNFTPATNGSVLVDTAGSGVNTVLAVYTNNTISTLQQVVATNDVGTRQQAYVLFDAKAGVNYRIAVAGYDSRSLGTIRLAIIPNGIPDTASPTVTLLSPASGVTLTTNRLVLVGTAVDPDPAASGLRDIEVRVTAMDFGPGDSLVSGAEYSATESLISTNWTRITGLFEGLNRIEISVRDFAGNRSAPVTIQATYRPLDPPNDFFVNAIALTGNASTNLVNTLSATRELNEPVHANNAGGRSAWWTYLAPADGKLVLSTTNSTFDTLLAVYEGTALTNLVRLAENDDDPEAAGGASLVTMAVRSNHLYRIAVDGYEGAGGALFLQHWFTPMSVYRVNISAGPGGVVSPGATDVLAGETVQLTALAEAGFSFDIWEGDVVALSNPLNLTVNQDRNLIATFRPLAFTEGFEAGLTNLAWTSAGASPWVVQSTNVATGAFAARSGVIGANQSSSLILTGNFREGLGSFGYRVSSEPIWDTLAFYVDGVLRQQWSGDTGWTGYGFSIDPGVHTLEWRYSKDSAGNVGWDAAFIDNVNLPLVVPTNATTAPILTIQRQTDGLFYIEIQGQPNQFYLLQTSEDAQSWETIASQVLPGGFTRILDPASGTNQVRFYRAVSPLP